ncbi:MAG TPA: 4Fe-4S dicluster domain-containing protein, partial [Thermoanaerobaculia bacterium]|nr:4Fe-4S dicluster domain-containing protein [Thermoanaerobaculia bacterium]
AYRIRAATGLWLATASVQKASGTLELATTQHHFNMEGRHLVRTGTFEEYRKDPGFARGLEEVPKISMYPGFKYDGHAWGLAVNLSSCTGCNACVVACQSENNIPTIGKEEVRRGREMHWIRIDRYYEGFPENPAVHNQPVMCMHCEQAPCEVVCPVAATTHSEEGINEMTYNRCIGTKYCSNNCPYKVRRFNFFDYNKDKHLPVLTLLANPNVTVRQKGVMEKCNYCIQRVNRARMDAEKENRPLRDGEILTACQQVCPTEALVFGDINDPASKVAKLRNEKLNYGLLEELNTRPRTTYLTKLTNPNTDFLRKE